MVADKWFKWINMVFKWIGYKAKKPVPGWKTGDIINVVKGKNAGLKGVRIKTVRSKGNA